MTDALRFHPSVATDLREAIQWYDEISSDLGDHFRSRIDHRFDEITRRPQSFPIAFDDVQFARIHRFPHLIIFREVSPFVRVLGLFQQ